MMTRWTRKAYATTPVALARALLGQRLVRILPDGTRLSGDIVETEAYLGVRDRAAHSFGGRRTDRNASMYLQAGTAYVYFIYGMHFCFNVVCGAVDEPTAVLVRGLVPVDGLDRMRLLRQARRKSTAPVRDADLCSGPAKLCAAMDIDRSMDGIDLCTSEALAIEHVEDVRGRVRRTPRIGVDYAGAWAQRPLRWILSPGAGGSR
ncbi:MAG: DNA-3-methyladenine glycosylase [Planctomycetota bacterium]